LGLTQAPCILANIHGYFDPLLALVEGAHTQGFISRRNRAIVESFSTVDAIVQRLGGL